MRLEFTVTRRKLKDSLGLCDLRNALMEGRFNISQCLFFSRVNTNMDSCKRVNIGKITPILYPALIKRAYS